MELVSYIERYIHIQGRPKYYLFNRYYLGKDQTVSKDQEILWAHCFLISLGTDVFVNAHQQLNLHHTVTLESNINVDSETKIKFIEYSTNLINGSTPSLIFDKSHFYDGLLMTDDTLSQKYLFCRCFLAGLNNGYLAEADRHSGKELSDQEKLKKLDDDMPPPLEDIPPLEDSSSDNDDDNDDNGESSSEEEEIKDKRDSKGNVNDGWKETAEWAAYEPLEHITN